MSEVDEMARMEAERLMTHPITSEELQKTVAGLILNLEKLSRAFAGVSAMMWTEDRLRHVVGEEMSKRCKLLHAADNAKNTEDRITSKWLSVGGRPAWVVAVFIGLSLLIMGILYVVK